MHSVEANRPISFDLPKAPQDIFFSLDDNGVLDMDSFFSVDPVKTKKAAPNSIETVAPTIKPEKKESASVVIDKKTTLHTELTLHTNVESYIQLKKHDNAEWAKFALLIPQIATQAFRLFGHGGVFCAHCVGSIGSTTKGFGFGGGLGGRRRKSKGHYHADGSYHSGSHDEPYVPGPSTTPFKWLMVNQAA